MHGLQADHIIAASCGEQAFASNALDGCIAAVARKLEFSVGDGRLAVIAS